ncbi:VWA domain-containing protein [Segatella bryantii]|jgi:Ca-activated chloride channel family protein|uniref:VWA domain-containing protein n=1 Tax=Segatella bryantii TaxID=77095 RepID=UPI001EDB6217|nr:VWA domain-containing protein [Segatella bryantii]MEE3415395.1 VWA domain-containing protein [Prevotella sp.]UKK73764.1 VWA domain-containing protein [Segatella bryantii]
MFRFDDPVYLWLLLLVPVMVLIRFVGWRRRIKKIKKFGDPELVAQLMPDISVYRPSVKFWLALGALSLAIIMLARPQMGTRISHDKRNGIETMIALDISNSMLAEDVAPSRLTKSKMLVENLVDHFNNDQIGLVVFAGQSYVQLPITSDYVSAKMFLQDIQPSLIQTQGTDIAGAINTCMHAFTPNDKVGKAIIVITDGEDHEGGAIEAAKAAHDRGINVFILGIGDSKGAPIPMGNGDYLKDRSGNTVMTAVNEQMCKQIAEAGSGKYIHVDNTKDAENQLNDDLSRLQKGETDSVIYSDYNEQFQAVAIVVMFLLILEICVLYRKNPLMKNIKIFKRK